MTNRMRWSGRSLALVVLAVTAGATTAAHASDEGRPATAGVARHRPAPNRGARGVDGRVELLTKALDLDARQKRQVKRLLEEQRDRVKAAWADSAVPPAVRVHRTQAIGEETADRIRALLDEDQKKRFGPPRQAREPAAPGRSVEDWMKQNTLM